MSLEADLALFAQYRAPDIFEEIVMTSTPGSPKPDETDSKAVIHQPATPGQSEAKEEIIKADVGEATASYRPADSLTPDTIPAKEEELILEREPDGRYRVVGRRSQKKK